ncbi:MAG: carboxypeptidase regulatory-like domain-containing protein [Gemmatimonas sp.]
MKGDIAPRRPGVVKLRWRWLSLALAGATLGSGAMLDAQTMVPFNQRQLVGVVRDAAGAAVADVNVAIPGSSTRTDARGAFQLFTTPIDTVTISLRRLGFEPVDALLSTRNRQWDTVVVQLESTAQRLNSVNVSESRTRNALGLRGFEERQKRGIGTFITREEIVERGAFKLSDLLRTKRGVVVSRGKVRFAAHTGSRASCQPDIWLDGIRSQAMEVDELVSATVEAMELYPYFSTVPMEFQRVGANTTPCGTIVIWTRVPNAKNR